MATSLYIHTPFCVVKCGYCDFNSYVADDDTALDLFLDSLDRELAQTDLPNRPSTVFIGGGTPSYFDNDRLARLLAILNRHADLGSVAEVTMEANPESLTEAKGRIARAAGVNRISIGAQTFDPSFLKLLDRAHNADQTRAAVGAMRSAGFDNLSLDLMFGLPGQQLAQWQSDLEQALALGPDHLSCYNLTFEAGTRFERDRRAGRMQPNDPDVDRDMFLFTRERLRSAGFADYEISNFAGAGGPCRHNDHYWLGGNYVGVGPGAASHRDGVRHTNLKPLVAWSDAVSAGKPPIAETETLTPHQRIAEALWLGLRRTDGVDLVATARRLGSLEPFEEVLGELTAHGWVRKTQSALTLTDGGLLFADEVAARLLAVPPVNSPRT